MRRRDDGESEDRSEAIGLLFRLLGERRGLFAGNLGLRLVKDLVPFLGPILLGIFVDLLSGTSGSDRSLLGVDLFQGDVRSILVVAGAMAVLAVVKSAVGYLHTIVAAHLGRHVVQAARRDIALASMHMRLDSRRKIGTGDLLDRCLADTKGLRSFTQNVLIRMISNTVRIVFPVVYMFTIDVVLAIVVLAVIPLQSGVSWVLQGRLKRQTKEARSREAAHTSVVKEALDGWMGVVSLGSQGWAAEEMHGTASASEDAKIAKKRTSALISVVITLCTSLGIAIVYAIGGWRIISSGVLDGNAVNGAFTLGTLTAFVGVAKKTYAPFQAYTDIVSSYKTGMVNLERIAHVLYAPSIDPRHDGPILNPTRGEVVLSGVSFAYTPGGPDTLSDVSARLPGQALTVITGASGEGKTTLLRILLGLDLPRTGTVCVDGQDINTAQLRSLQDAVVLVPQQPVLFTGTVRENLLLGLGYRADEDILSACDAAGFLDVVQAMPAELNTMLGSGHQELSGGQLRRLSIARALLRDAAVLLLDEPTAGLDPDTGARLLHELWGLTAKVTIVMVSHARRSVGISDHHLVMVNGRLIPEPDIDLADPSPVIDLVEPAPVIDIA